MFPNRTYCDTLHEMREILKYISTDNLVSHKNSVNILNSLIEECQVYGNRMEAGLGDKYDMREAHEDLKKAKLKLKAVKKKLALLESKAEAHATEANPYGE